MGQGDPERIPDVRLSCGPVPCSRSTPPQVVRMGDRFLSLSLFSLQLSRDATHGIPRPARPSAQPSLVLSGSPWLPEQPEGGLAASGATSPRKPYRANDCWGPREARPARSRSCRRTRRVHKLRVCSQPGQCSRAPGPECPPPVYSRCQSKRRRDQAPPGERAVARTGKRPRTVVSPAPCGWPPLLLLPLLNITCG